MPARLSLTSYVLLVLVLLSACASAPEQVISGDPRAYLLTAADLPTSATYYMPENGAFLVPNAAVIAAFGPEKGQALINETERVNSASVHFQRTEDNKPAPVYYVVTVTIHQSAKGARAAVEKYNIASLYPDGGWTIVQDNLSIGDVTLVETGQTANPSGQKVISHRVEFAYRNVSVDVLVAGLEKDVTLETAAKAARLVLARLKASPLSKPPIPTLAQPDLPQ